jgi:hypothetical protein
MALDNADTIFAQDAPAPGGETRFLADDQGDWRYWVNLITVAWQSKVGKHIEIGRQLNEAKLRLAHGEFGKMIEKSLPFKRGTAQQLMKIARNPILSNASHAKHLPAQWATLAAMDRLDLSPAELTALINNHTINDRMTRAEVAKLKPGATAAPPRESPMANLSQKNKELSRQILDLESALTTAKQNDGGDLFDCKKTDPKEMAKIIVGKSVRSGRRPLKPERLRSNF